MHKRHRDNSDAVAAFIAKKAEIDIMLTRLTALSEEHFNADQLKRITDTAFHEGEQAD